MHLFLGTALHANGQTRFSGNLEAVTAFQGALFGVTLPMQDSNITSEHRQTGARLVQLKVGIDGDIKLTVLTRDP